MLIEILQSYTLEAKDGTVTTYFKQPRCDVPKADAIRLVKAKVARKLEKPKPKYKPKQTDSEQKPQTRGKRTKEE